MAKPNYSFAKRQRELAKKAKKEEKLRLKQQAQESSHSEDGADTSFPAEPVNKDA